MVRRLVREVTSRIDIAQAQKAIGDAAGVILDLEINGVRCVLARSQPVPVGPRIVLSPREKEIARMVAKGHPNKVIAAVLEMSPWTVCTHLRRLFAKLGVSSRAAMVARLAEEGLLADSPARADRSSPSHP